MSARCEVGERDGAEVVPCGEPAPYAAQDWGHGPGHDELACCEHHAAVAIHEGAEVLGPGGHRVLTDDAGELYEVAS